uniref:CP12-2 n=1 Tax=Arundo donax TaxID=35708 RepID=A0A0A9D697_ARUDO
MHMLDCSLSCRRCGTRRSRGSPCSSSPAGRSCP